MGQGSVALFAFFGADPAGEGGPLLREEGEGEGGSPAVCTPRTGTGRGRGAGAAKGRAITTTGGRASTVAGAEGRVRARGPRGRCATGETTAGGR